ncbi:hypothetical protein [Micromonospora sp. NPDC048169]|uniref:hypothetical protein n=1 Tax=Micromonospora sp. NPDC048169 TaxID=3154711 RepID=UPI0034106EB0
MTDISELIAKGRALLPAPGEYLTSGQAFDLAEWAGLNLPAMLDALEAAQRPPLGYVVLAKRESRTDPAVFEYAAAGAIWPERDPVENHQAYCQMTFVEDPKKRQQSRPAEYVIAELREVQS